MNTHSMTMPSMISERCVARNAIPADGNRLTPWELVGVFPWILVALVKMEKGMENRKEQGGEEKWGAGATPDPSSHPHTLHLHTLLRFSLMHLSGIEPRISRSPAPRPTHYPPPVGM